MGFFPICETKGTPKDLRTFRSRLTQIQNFIKNDGCPNISALTTEYLEKYTVSLSRNSPKKIARKLRLLKSFLEYAHNNGYIVEPLAPVIPK